ncbi:MAG: OpgC domain-containing protein [Candidatus Saccharimonadales bacterium]
MDKVSSRRERIIALDILRGFFLTIIIVDHLHYFPGLFELVGGRGELWVSAAEGFFLVSGLLVGYIYTPKMAANAWVATKRILRRAGLLYFWAMVLTTTAVIWAHLAHSAGLIKPGLWWNPPVLEYIYKTMTLQYNYGWGDFLQYYVLFMLFAPLAVWLCVKKKAWLVLLLSVTIYLFRGHNFNMAWQIMFMGGIVIGHYLPQLEAKVKEIPKKIHKKVLRRSLYVVAVASLIASVIITFGAAAMETFMGSNIPAWLMPLHNTLASWNAALAPSVFKWTLEPMRIVFAVIWFSALYIVVRRREAWIDKKTFGFFRTLGEVSLLIYGAHALVIFGAHLYLPENFGYVVNTIVTALFLASFYCLARYRSYFKLGYKKIFGKWREV